MNGGPQAERLGVVGGLGQQGRQLIAGLLQRVQRRRLLGPVGGQRHLVDDETVVRPLVVQDLQQYPRTDEIAGLRRRDPGERQLQQHFGGSRIPGRWRGRVVVGRFARCSGREVGCHLRDRAFLRWQQVAQEGVNGAVDFRGADNLGHRVLQLLLEARRLLTADVLAEVLVATDHEVAHVEVLPEALLGDDDRGVRPQPVTHAELERRIDVLRRKVGDHQLGAEQMLIHRLVDGARVLDLVGAEALVPCRLDRFLDDGVRGIEVEFAAVDVVGLPAKPLNDETPCHARLLLRDPDDKPGEFHLDVSTTW